METLNKVCLLLCKIGVVPQTYYFVEHLASADPPTISNTKEARYGSESEQFFLKGAPLSYKSTHLQFIDMSETVLQTLDNIDAVARHEKKFS